MLLKFRRYTRVLSTNIVLWWVLARGGLIIQMKMNIKISIGNQLFKMSWNNFSFTIRPVRKVLLEITFLYTSSHLGIAEYFPN